MSTPPPRRWRRLSLGLLLLSLEVPGAPVRGQNEGTELLIGEPPRLVVGGVAAVELTVRIPAADRQPLLLTPSVEGEAVRVVRGRLLRDDAVRADGRSLVFTLPLAARRPGAALLRVSLLTYRCDGTTCRELRAEVSRMLQVSAR